MKTTTSIAVAVVPGNVKIGGKMMKMSRTLLIEVSPEVTEAREAVVKAALLCLTTERAVPGSLGDTAYAYAADKLAIASRDLCDAVDADDRENRPIGW